MSSRWRRRGVIVALASFPFAMVAYGQPSAEAPDAGVPAEAGVPTAEAPPSVSDETDGRAPGSDHSHAAQDPRPEGGATGSIRADDRGVAGSEPQPTEPRSTDTPAADPASDEGGGDRATSLEPSGPPLPAQPGGVWGETGTLPTVPWFSPSLPGWGAAAPPASPSTPVLDTAQPAPSAAPSRPGFVEEEWSVGIPSWAHGQVGSALLLLVLLLGLSTGLQWTRRRLPSIGVIPAFLRLAELAVRLCVFFAATLLAVRLLWGAFGDAYKWILVAAALGVGWSVRDILPDLVAAIVLRFESRVRPGVWVAGAGFEGVVERRALRAVWLKDPSGDRVAVPNRRMLGEPLRVQDGMGALCDVPLRLQDGVPAVLARSAILEAVVTSPYVAPDVRAAIRRDGATPGLWHVRASLLDERYARAFGGELLERVEAVLGAVNAGQ